MILRKHFRSNLKRFSIILLFLIVVTKVLDHNYYDELFSNLLPRHTSKQTISVPSTKEKELLHRTKKLIQKSRLARKYPSSKENVNEFAKTIGDGADQNKEKTIFSMNETQFYEMINNQKQGVTKEPVDIKQTKVCVENHDCMPASQYMKWKAEQFVLEVNFHLDKERIPPTLVSYPENMLRPNPLVMVHDASMSVDYDLVDRELKRDKKRRMELGDDDLLKNPSILKVISQRSGYVVPNMVHFIWFGCRKFKIHHYMSMLSAFRFQKPDLILLHTNCTPEGDYWNAFKDVSGSTLIIVRRSPTPSIFGNPINKVEHQSDVARLQILLEIGGIYIDDDILFLKSFDELRNHQTVLAEENYDALGNGVILSSTKSWFLHRWFQEYENFNDSRWSDSSCFVPWSLWRLFPSTVTIVKEKILRPNWEEVTYLYRELWDWRKNYAIHLYSRYMKLVDGVEERTFEELAVLNTTYGEIARYIIWGNPQIIDPLKTLFT